MPKDKPTDDDITAFRQAMCDVQPLKQPNKLEPKKSLSTKPRYKSQAVYFEDFEDIEDFLSDHITTIVHADEKLFFAKTGLQHKLIHSLQQGKILAAASLDLHKMTVVMARHAVTQFITESLQASYRCIHIIHGKGKLNKEAPILKNHVNSWLQQHSDVLAFCSARPRDGGVGAVYILLRNVNK